MKDFKITITSEDLKDPAKLACLESIIGTCFTNGCITSILKGVDSENECFIGDNLYAPVGLLSDDDYQAEDEITLLYSQIKLDPRKLIGESVEVVRHRFDERKTGFIVNASKSISRLDENLQMGDDTKQFFSDHDKLKLSPTWLKQNFKCEEV